MSPKSPENIPTVNTDEVEAKGSKLTDSKLLKRASAGALAIGLGLGVAGCADGEPAPTPSESVSTETPSQEPTETIEPTNEPSPTDLPGDVDPSDPETGEGKQWGKFELPTPEREVMYNFGSKEDFLNWFVIDADTYTTPEDIAKKHVMNLEGFLNAGFSYQLDENLSYKPDIYQPENGKMLSPNKVAAVHEAYDKPIAEKIAVPGTDTEDLIKYDYKLNRASLFVISYYYRNDEIPYTMSTEYYDSSVVYMNADNFADATEITLEIHSGDSDNGLKNMADWARESGQPAQMAVDYVDHVAFTLDTKTNSWLFVDDRNISKERKDIA